MELKTARFHSFLFIALSLAPALAHRLELPARIRSLGDESLTVQLICRGWALLGIVIFAAILAALATVLRRENPAAFRLSLAALVPIGAQAVFGVFTFPANHATQDGTSPPPDWMALRDRWEYSEAAGACLTPGAFPAATPSACVGEGGRSDAIAVRKETA